MSTVKIIFGVLIFGILAFVFFSLGLIIISGFKEGFTKKQKVKFKLLNILEEEDQNLKYQVLGFIKILNKDFLKDLIKKGKIQNQKELSKKIFVSFKLNGREKYIHPFI